MSSSDIDVSQLSDSERTALDTYTAVTSQDISEAIPLLRRSQWNVQVSQCSVSNKSSKREKTHILINRCIDCDFQIFRR